MDTTNYTGYVGDIAVKNSPNGFEKKIITLKMRDKQVCYIECRNDIVQQQLNDISKGDRVEVAARLEGKISRNSGIQYNNIVAKSITKSIL